MAIRVIKAAAGLGKTSILLKLLEDSPYGKVEIYVPTHALGEHVSNLLRMSVHHVAIKGRSHPYNSSRRMCARHKEAELLVDKGYPVYPILCARRDAHGNVEQCEHYSRCPYIAQFQGPEQVYIYTHASLPLERGALEDIPPQLAAIDESFFKSCIEVFPVSVTDLTLLPTGDHSKVVCAAIVQILETSNPLLAEFRSRSLETRLNLAIDENKPTLPHFSPYWPDSKQAKALAALAPRPRILEMLQALRAELATGRSESHAFMLDRRNGVVLVHRRLPITRFVSGKRRSDILILDADADRLLVQQWFPDAAFDDIPAARNVYITQCTSTRCSTTSLVPDRNADPGSKHAAERRLKDLQTLIDRRATAGKQLLVVGPQAITGNVSAGIPSLLTVPAGSELAHFGAIRGVDRWKDFGAAIIVGRNQPPIEAVEGIARAVWSDDPKPLEFAADWQVAKRGYRVRGGVPATGVEVIVHPDPRVQAVLEQLRERESTQAIDRLRLIHTPYPKEVILLSNIPLDVDVDELRSWDEITLGTRLERAWAQLNGTIPLAPRWLANRFPDLWSSADAAEADLRTAGKNREVANWISLSKPTVYTLRYREAGQKRPSRALSVLPLDATHFELTRLMGDRPLVVAQLVDGVAGPEHFLAVGTGAFQPMSASGEAESR